MNDIIAGVGIEAAGAVVEQEVVAPGYLGQMRIGDPVAGHEQGRRRAPFQHAIELGRQSVGQTMDVFVVPLLATEYVDHPH